MTTEDHNDERSIDIQGNVDRSVVVSGDGNIVTCNVLSPVGAEPFPARPSQQLSEEEYRWRQVLVQSIKHDWIEDYLEHSLYNHVLIDLGLEEHSQTVNSLSRTDVFVKKSERLFPEGTQVSDVFDDLGAGRTLLILGEPGAGKTTTLLRVVKTLITRIENDFSQSIPVILNLSSWSIKRQPFSEWLAQELFDRFRISKAASAKWIKEEQLTLCLDGLDEVVIQHRNACVRSLNEFLQNHGRTEVIICSRLHDYESLSERLSVRSAIYVQPLTSEQIDRYLTKAGEHLSTLKAVLTQNTEIRALAASPLILSVMSLAYQGYAIGDFPEIKNAQSFHQCLFDTYIERMFQRRITTHSYDDSQAKYWLVWLAQRMVQTSQSVFFVENVQPSWLQNRNQRLRYRVESALMFGLSVGLVLVLSAVLGAVLLLMLSVTLSADLFVPLDLILEDGLSVWLRALLFSLSVNLFFGLVAGLTTLTLGDITPVETLKWSWKEFRKFFRSGLVYALSLWSIYLLAALLSQRGWDEIGMGWSVLINLLINTLTFCLLGGLLGGLIGGLRGPDMVYKTKTNQGIWQSARNAVVCTLIVLLLGGLIGGLIGGLSTGLVNGLNVWLISGLINGSAYGLVVGLYWGPIVGLLCGGSACIRHVSLRLMLSRMGYAPWDYSRFLDYAAERVFLQKVGGGYIFMHRMLLEHFSQIEMEQKYYEKSRVGSTSAFSAPETGFYSESPREETIPNFIFRHFESTSECLKKIGRWLGHITVRSWLQVTSVVILVGSLFTAGIHFSPSSPTFVKRQIAENADQWNAKGALLLESTVDAISVELDGQPAYQTERWLYNRQAHLGDILAQVMEMIPDKEKSYWSVRMPELQDEGNGYLLTLQIDWQGPVYKKFQGFSLQQSCRLSFVNVPRLVPGQEDSQEQLYKATSVDCDEDIRTKQ